MHDIAEGSALEDEEVVDVFVFAFAEDEEDVDGGVGENPARLRIPRRPDRLTLPDRLRPRVDEEENARR